LALNGESDMPSNFLFEKNGPITTITFNRPERRNCMNTEVMREMESLLFKVRDDPETRVLVVTGAGNSFSAGADLTAAKGVTDPRERQEIFRNTQRHLPRLIGRAFEALTHLDAVTIGAINGYAIGGGWAIALGFDLCIAVEDAEFWVPEVDLGVPFDGQPANILAAHLGPWHAKEAIITCRHFKARELFELGLINRVVKRDELMPAVKELAQTVAAKNSRATTASKMGINTYFFGPR
jgi:enoyl-CoA hydratase